MNRNHWSIRKSKDDQFYFVFVAKNGEIMCTSEMYTQKHNALEGCKIITKSCSSYSVMIKDDTVDER